MNGALRCSVVALFGMVLASGCATGGTFADLTAEHGRLTDVKGSLDKIGRFPTPEVMAQDVQLVSFPYSTAGVAEERRDTINGALAVSAWLEAWHGRQLPDVEFFLSSDEVRRCAGVAVQDGSYRIKGTTSSSEIQTQSYRARWAEARDGGWALDRLWLDPPPEAKVANVASGCRSLREVERASHRVFAHAEFSFATSPLSPTLTEAMRDVGWTQPTRGTAYPNTVADGLGFALGLGYRLTPQVAVEGLAVAYTPSSIRGRFRTKVREPRLREATRMVALLGSWTFGFVQLGAGPALAFIDLDWTDKYTHLSESGPVSVGQARFGVLGQLCAYAPAAISGRPYLALRYAFLANADVPPFYDLPAVDASLSRISLGLGLGFSF